MSGSTPSKASERKRTGQAERPVQEPGQRSTPFGPEADILDLQRVAGNRAIGQFMRSNVDESVLSDNVVPPIIEEVLKSGSGQPLDSGIRSVFEASFRQDFSGVVVHTNRRAAESAQAMNAQAYTVGRHVVFGAGKYAPATTTGKWLLAHEMTHVAQQNDGIETRVMLPPTDKMDRWEAEAESMAGQVVSFEPAAASSLKTVAEQTISPAPFGVIQTLSLTPHGQGGRVSGLMERDRQSIFGKREQRHMSAIDFTLPQAIQGGKHQIVKLDSETLKGADIWHRLAMFEKLLDGWTGNAEEEAIIRILQTTPDSQAAELFGRLKSESVGGESLLDRLDRDVDLGNNLELHDELSQLRLKAMGPKAYTQEIIEKSPVLPWRDAMDLPGMDDRARFRVWGEHGKIWVKYPFNTSTSKDFAEEMTQLKQLVPDIFYNGHAFDPEQLLIVHDYDREGKFVPLLADQLTGYRRAEKRAVLAEATDVASWGIPGGGAAKTVVGKAAVALGRALSVATFLVNQNRLQIVKWFPNWGPKMLYFSDLVQAGVGMYGLAQFARSGWQLFKSWRDLKRPKLANLDSDAERVALELERARDEIVKHAEIIRNAEAEVPSIVGRQPTGSAAPQLKPGGGVTDLAAFKAARKKSVTPTNPPSEPAAQQAFSGAANEDVEQLPQAMAAGDKSPGTFSSSGSPIVATAGGHGKKSGKKSSTPPQRYTSRVKKPPTGAKEITKAYLKEQNAKKVGELSFKSYWNLQEKISEDMIVRGAGVITYGQVDLFEVTGLGTGSFTKTELGRIPDALLVDPSTGRMMLDEWSATLLERIRPGTAKFDQLENQVAAFERAASGQSRIFAKVPGIRPDKGGYAYMDVTDAFQRVGTYPHWEPDKVTKLLQWFF